MYFGCRPEAKKKEEFIKYDPKKGIHVRKADEKILKPDETYCRRKIPKRVWKGKERLENRIWAVAGLGIPDLIDGDIVVEAKGGLPSSQKVRTALGQLLFYREHNPSFKLGFLFPKTGWKQKTYRTTSTSSKNTRSPLYQFDLLRVTAMTLTLIIKAC